MAAEWSAAAPAEWTIAALLPGFWVAAFAALLVLASRRWLDRIAWPVAVIWVVAIALLLWPVLVGGDVLLPLGLLTRDAPYASLPDPEPPSHGIQSDLVREIHPWQVRVRRALTAGRWPLWNEDAGAGMGLLADPQSQALQPLALATLLVSDAAAPGLLTALRVLAALSGMYLLLRRQGLGEPAALLGSLAHGLGAPVLMWLGYPLAGVLALQPWPLYAIVRCDQRGARGDWLLLAVTLAALLLAGHPEATLHALFPVAAFLAAAVWRRRRSIRAFSGLLAPALLALGVAVALAAPVVLPARTLLMQSHRAAVLAAQIPERPWEEVWRRAVDRVSDPAELARWRERVRGRLAAVVSARSRGDMASHWGEGNFLIDGGIFNAAPVMLLALAGAAPARRRLSGERTMQGVTLAALAIAAQPAGLVAFASRVGILRLGVQSHHHRLLLVAAFGLAYLAACEADRWARGERRLGPLAFGVGTLAPAIVWAYLAFPRGGVGEGLFWLERRMMTIELAALGCAALALAVAGLRLRAGRARAAAVTGCALVAGAELLFFLQPTARPAPARLYYPDAPPLAFLQRRLGADRFAATGSALQPNYAQVHGLNDLRIHGPSRPAAYDRVLQPVASDPHRGMDSYFMVGRFDHPLYDLLGARFVLAPRGTELPLQVAWRRHKSDWVYERAGWLPRLFLPRATLAVSPAEVDANVAANLDFADLAIVAATDPKGQPRRWRARKARIALDRVELLEPERIAARATLRERRLLASSILQDGGWRLLAGGVPRRVLLANGPFVAAWLPARRQPLELLYRPPGFLLGCTLAALALGLVACAGVAPPGARARPAGGKAVVRAR